MRKITVLLAFLFLASMQFAFAQTRTINGKVTSSEDGQGIPGVTIQVKGTAVGTVTDIDGNYSLEVKPSYNTLIFQYVGMKTQTIAIGDQNNINIAMDPDVLEMEEVVVTAIGIPKESKALGYTVQEVTAEDIAKSGNTNVVNALQGRVAGVEVTNSSGAAGGSSYITIRGSTSIIGNNQPLFVIDGVPISNATTRDDDGFQNDDVAGVARGNRALDLNPDDIETINVLKGGAASALYGIRGANGVIVITTKKGKPGKGKKVNVQFSSSLQFSQISQVPELNTKYSQGSGGEWRTGNASTWGAQMSTLGYSKDDSWVDGGWSGFDVDGDLVPMDSDRYDPSLGAAKNYDNYDFFQTGVLFTNSLSLTGGGDKGTFYISAADMVDKGVVPNNKYRRNNFKISGSSALSDKFKISGNATYIMSNSDGIQQGSNTSGVMLGLLRTPQSFDNAGILTINGEETAPNSWSFNDGSQRNYRHGGGYDNPYWTANENLWNGKIKRLIGNVQLDWLPTQWLRFTYRPGLDWYSEEVKNYLAVGSRTNPGGYVYARNTVARDFNSDLIAYMTHDFNEKWSGYITLGWNLSERRQNYVYGQANGLSIPDYYNLNNSANILTGEVTWQKRNMGVFFDIGFSYNKMIYFNVTGRNDWSTTLPEQNNSFFYPSANLSFIVTELPGLKDSKAVPYWKVFGSYAITANDADPYRTSTYFFQTGVSDGWVQPLGVNFPVNTGGSSYNGFTLGNTLGNDQLKPERTRTMEIGTNIKFINNRLGLDVTYFNNLSEDLLLPVDIDPSSGFSFAYLNAASMSNKGIEVALYAAIFKKKNFTWDLQVNFATFKNVVEELAPGVDAVFLGGFTGSQIRAVAGEEYRTMYGYDWHRTDDGTLIINDDPDSPGYGYPMGVDTLSVLGKINPTWTMGIANTFSFYNFQVYFLIDWRQGNNMWNGTKGALYYFGAHADNANREDDYVFEGVGGHFQPETGDKVIGDQNDVVVQLDQNWRQNLEGSGFTGPSVDYVEDAGWIRLRDVTVSYSFNQLLKDSFVDNLELYVTLRNMWLSTSYTGIDPETSLLGASNAQGIDYFNMPGLKTYMVGLRFSF